MSRPLRVLFISAFYPPYGIGGWDQLTQELVDGLRNRGHVVQVLTSGFRANGRLPGEDHITRALHLQNDQVHYRPTYFWLRRRTDLRRNLAAVRRLVAAFRPQAAMVHSMWNLSRAVPWQAEQLLPGRVAYYIADHWPCEPDVDDQFWNSQQQRGGTFGWRRRLAERALRDLARETCVHRLALSNLVLVSQARKQHLITDGLVAAARGCVIYNGVDAQQFSPAEDEIAQPDPALLFAGSLAPHKGLSTLLQSLALVREDPACRQVSLNVAGTAHPHQVRRVQSEIERLGLTRHVKLRGAVPRRQMPSLYRGARAVVIPSICPEGMPRATQEAMACGRPVISTLTGGSVELVVDGVNGLAFEAGDASQLAAQIRRVWTDPDLARRLGQAARQTIEHSFTMDRMINRVEDYLATLASQGA
jgi:glycosyltransferase involved in cell wall biosynthesis